VILTSGTRHANISTCHLKSTKLSSTYRTVANLNGGSWFMRLLIMFLLSS
jgi:hypothetical protein